MILKTVFTRTFKIPAELGDWKDPLNGRGRVYYNSCIGDSQLALPTQGSG
jgi:hypothetical protein